MIQVVPFTEERRPAVEEFNRRMTPARVSAFPESVLSPWLPQGNGHRMWEEHYVAVEGESVRGGYILMRHHMWFGGELIPVGGLRLPISEGLVNGAYRLVGIQVVKDALRKQPLLFGMGMDGEQTPIAKLLKALKFRLEPVPFYFKVKHGARFLREVPAVGPRASKLAVYTGAAWAGAKVLDLALTRNRWVGRRAAVDLVDRFEDWADGVWEESKGRYTMVGLRDSHALNLIYPPENRRFLRLRMKVDGRVIGWAVALDLRLDHDERFGNLRAGVIMDCLATPENAGAVIGAASRMLEARGVDFVRSHQYHPAWRQALQRSGFLQGPSYFLFGAAPAFAEKLDAVDAGKAGVHLNRGDGDSPLYLPLRGTPG